MNKSMLPYLVLALIFSPLGCEKQAPSTPPAPATEPDSAPVDAAPSKIFGRAGSVQLDLAGVRRVVATARVLNHWRRGQAPDPQALADAGLRRQVVIQGLETRVVRAEFARRGLGIEPGALNNALENAARGRPADAPPPTAAPDTLDARLSAYYSAPADVVREAVADVLRSARLADVLVAEVPEDEVRASWRAENTRLELDVLQIPRVPATTEITRFVRTRGDEIDIAYEAERHRFNVPERAVVHRLVVADKQRAQELRATIVASDDPAKTFAETARKHSSGPNARNGGRLGALSAKKLPLAFELEEGSISEPVPFGDTWALFRLERRLPAQARPKEDASVRRELAAELLRKADDLPHAKKIADRVRLRLAQSPDGEQLAALIKAERVRRHQTKSFDLTGRAVPGVGLAPALLETAKALSPAKPVSAAVRVRQNYIVVRLIKRHEPTTTWAAAKSEYVKKWRARMRPRIVDRWLSKHLSGEKLWVDMEQLRAIPTEALL